MVRESYHIYGKVKVLSGYVKIQLTPALVSVSKSTLIIEFSPYSAKSDPFPVISIQVSSRGLNYINPSEQ